MRCQLEIGVRFKTVALLGFYPFWAGLGQLQDEMPGGNLRKKVGHRRPVQPGAAENEGSFTGGKLRQGHDQSQTGQSQTVACTSNSWTTFRQRRNSMQPQGE